MKNLSLILLLAILNSCSNSKTEQIVVEKFPESNPEIKGVETCNCPAPFDKAEHQLKIPYQDNYLKFCAFEYSDLDKTASEFRIFDNKDSMVFAGDPPFVYQISDLKAPIQVIESVEINFDDSEELKSLPAVIYNILEQEGQFKVEEKFILQSPFMSKQKMDSLLTVFKKQPLLTDNGNKLNSTFASEEFETDLFICAINGNRKCLEAFENLESKFETDGAIAELYSELSHLLNVYKSDKGN